MFTFEDFKDILTMTAAVVCSVIGLALMIVTPFADAIKAGML
jgi:hypothetical protein